MALGAGYKGKLGAAKETTYRTAVTVDELIPFLDEGINKEFVRIAQAWLNARAGLEADDRGGALCDGLPLNGELTYDVIAGSVCGVDLIMGAALGTGAWDATNLMSQYTLAENVDNHITLAVEKDVSVWEAISAKIATLEISGVQDEVIKWAIAANAHNVKRTGDSGIVNTSTTIANLSPTNLPGRVRWEHLTFRIADDADALAAADKLSIREFTLSLNNALSAAEHATVENTGHTDAVQPLEHERSGQREVTFSIVIPRYTADTFFTHYNNDEKLQADLKFTDGTNQFNIYIPTLKVISVGAPVPGPELVTVTVEFQCFRQHADNTFMKFTDAATSIGEEFGIETKNARTTHALA